MDTIKVNSQDVCSTPSNGKTVLISGASGFVAAHVLNSFLERGYHVKATVRSNSTAESVKKTHEKYASRLSFAIVKDVAAAGAFDEAVQGVDGVIHTASPFVMECTNNETDLLIPAINGTTSILKAIQAHNPHVKRVVITSSFAAIFDPFHGARPGHTYSERDWNPCDYETAKTTTSGVLAYTASKALAEKAAFAFVDANQPAFTITTICPPMIYGPAAHAVASFAKLNTSSADIYRLMDGSEARVPETGLPAFVDVRDVGEAHVRAYESERAGGQRYLVAAGKFTYQQVCDIIRERFPEKKGLVPQGAADGEVLDCYGVDNSKARVELGMSFRSLEETIEDQVKEFIELERKLGIDHNA